MNKVWAILVRDARLALSTPWSIFLAMAEAAVSVIVAYFVSIVAGAGHVKFGVAGMTYFGFLSINIAFVRYQTAAMLGFADVLRYSLYAGTFEVTLVTPTKISTLLLGSSLWTFTFTTMQVITYLVVSMFFGLSLTNTNVPALIVLMFLTMASSVPLGVLVAALAVRYNKSGPIDFLVSTATMVFGGIYIPLTALPAFMQFFGWFLPIAHALAGLRAAVGGASLLAVGGEVLWLGIATVVLLPLSLWIFDLVIRRAKAKGNLASF